MIVERSGQTEATHVFTGRLSFKKEFQPAANLLDQAQKLGFLLDSYGRFIAIAGEVITTSPLQAAAFGNSTPQVPLLERIFPNGEQSILHPLELAIDPDRREEFHSQVEATLRQITERRSKGGLIARRREQDRRGRISITDPLEQQLLQNMMRFVVDNADAAGFRVLKDEMNTGNLSSGDNLQVLIDRQHVELATLRLDSNIQALEVRKWLSEMNREARRGVKIYQTPYYSAVIEDCIEAQERKDNVGGVLLYGGPGTGKTRGLIEKNRAQGFSTRVINIHYYTSANTLLADTAIQLGIDKGASLASKLDLVYRHFQDQPDQFREIMTGVFRQLQKEEKVPEDEQLVEFLRAFVEPNALDNEEGELDWDRIRNSFLERQRVRILRTALSDNLQEDTNNVVVGEILLAIQRGERVILDEVDKAGPGALGGILSFLSTPKGEYYVYGQQRTKIPKWFVVDGTSNATNLTSFLNDRFVIREIDPPLLDRLMIASVMVSNSSGDILLSPFEQHQLVWFYTYLIPEIKQIVEKENNEGNEIDVAPLSIRGIQEFTSYLVDPESKVRTNRTFAQAVYEFLLKNPVWSKEKQLFTELTGRLNTHRMFLEPWPLQLVANEEYPPLKQRERAVLFWDETINSPLTQAITDLMEVKNTSQSRIIRLTDDQLARVEEFLQGQSVNSHNTALGLVFELRDSSLKISYAPETDDIRRLGEQRVSIQRNAEIINISKDGKKVFVKNGNNILILDSFRADDKPPTISFSPDSKLQSDALGNNFVVQASGEVKVYQISQTDKPILTIPNVTDSQISSNGKWVFVRLNGGQAKLYSLELFGGQIELPKEVEGEFILWRGFAGDNLIVGSKDDNSLSSTAVLLS